MNKERKNIIENNEISQIYSFKLGGYLQKVLIEGKSKELPIVITLHGGPGTPIPFSVGCRGMFPSFTDRFIMVYWDQLGCGINNYKITNDFSIKDFVNMAHDLIAEVKKLFPNNKLFIFSTSWGSILSALVLEKNQNEIDGVVVCGQIIKNIFFNDAVIKILDNSNVPKAKLDIIKKTNSNNATSKELQLVSQCLTKYTNAYNNKNGKKAPTGEVIKGLLTSPDYKFKDFKAIMINGYKKNTSLWNELLKIDLTDTLSKINIPYIILQGDTDVVAYTQDVKELVEKSNNKNIKCYIVKNTGHLPGIEMMEEIQNKLIELATIV